MKFRALRGGWLLGLSLGSSAVMAAVPCPPPQVSVQGGASVSTDCPQQQAGNSYSTNFSATENPISEGGKWTNGQVAGGDWNNVQTVAGSGAFGANYAGGYNDPIAILNTTFPANQFAQGTVRRSAGYAPGVSHEVELLLRFKVTSHNARGYEVLYSNEGWLVIVRWNGPLSNYTELASTGGPVGGAAPRDGDVIRAEASGSTIKVFKNGSQVLSATDSTWTDGQPGMGFWPKPGATLTAYGWKSYTAGAL